MKEIGGYMGFEQFHGRMLHGDGVRLNCGRNCLAYLIKARGIRRIAVPYFMCDSVFDVCIKHQVSLRFYHVGMDLRPENLELEENEWFYLMNYYAQLTTDEIAANRERYKRVIVDNSQAYFDEPVSGVDTLYTCRKFFGVPDGAILYTNAKFEEPLGQDESFQHMEYLLGRFERTASEFYEASSANNKRFQNEPLKRMSKLTENLLRGIDYEEAEKRRSENFSLLASRLKRYNRLRLRETRGAFAFPLMVENAPAIRKELIAHNVYVPVLWPNVLEQTSPDTTDFRLAQEILPIPCDHRYGQNEMGLICDLLSSILN